MPSSRIDHRKPSVWLWISTVVLSIGLHVGLLHLNPNLMPGSGRSLNDPQRSERKNMQVRPVKPELMRKELPRLLDQFASASAEAAATESPIDLPDPDARLFEQNPPALPEPEWEHQPAELPREVPPMSESVTDWQPRQEVLTVTERRVAETLDVLPRTLRDVATDRPGAPDISLPGPSPDLPEAGPVSTGFQALHRGEVPGALPMWGLPLNPASGSGSGTGNPGLPSPDLPEMKIQEIESPADITQLKAVESLLRLETRVFDDPADPEFRYFKIQLLPNGIDSLPVLPRDVVYLLDCSASMTEHKLRLAVAGINESLESLSEHDRVNVIAFRDEVELFSPRGVEATVFGKARVRTFLSSLRARGQTDVYASLTALQSLPEDDARPMLAMLVTDGVPTRGQTDSSQIIEAFSRRNQGKISVFGLGGGGRVNLLLLDFLSFRNRGSSLVSPQAQGLSEAIKQTAKEIGRPVLVNLDYQFSGTREPEVYPVSLSHLYLDRSLILIGRTLKSQPRLAFQIVGQSARGNHDILFTLNLDEAPEGSASLRREWAWQALLEELSSSISTLGDQEPAARERARELIETYDLEIPDAYRP